MKLKHILFAGAEADSDFRAYHDNAYNFWKTNWQQTFEELKTQAKLKADDFTRQNYITGLFDGEEAIGLLLHTRFSLELTAVREHSYLAGYPAEMIEQLKAEGNKDILSMEYLTLSPKWRKAEVGISLAKVILGLGANLAADLGINAIQVTRVDRAVNSMLAEFGSQVMVPGLTMHNVTVDLMRLRYTDIRPCPDTDVNQLIDRFRRDRLDLVGIKGPAAFPIRKAA